MQNIKKVSEHKSKHFSSFLYYARRGRKGTLLTSSENTRVDKVPLPRSAYAIFYNTCVISDVF